MRKPKQLLLSDTQISTWFERDRSHVELSEKDTDKTILEWWDEAVGEAVEDGFLSPRNWHASAFHYAQHLGIIA